jgi:hypothetical protein
LLFVGHISLAFLIVYLISLRVQDIRTAISTVINETTKNVINQEINQNTRVVIDVMAMAMMYALQDI